MSEESVTLQPTVFTNRDCAKETPPAVIDSNKTVKIPMSADSKGLVITIIPTGGNVTAILKGRGIYSDKSLTCENGKCYSFRNFESAWHKHSDGCVHLEFTVGSGASSTVIATEGD